MNWNQLSQRAEDLSFCPTGEHRSVWELYQIGWDAKGPHSAWYRDGWLHIGWTPNPQQERRDLIEELTKSRESERASSLYWATAKEGVHKNSKAYREADNFETYHLGRSSVYTTVIRMLSS